MLRTLTLLLITCGALFTAAAQVRQLVALPPTAEDLEAFQYLRLHTPADAVVLAPEPMLVIALAQRKAIGVDERISRALSSGTPQLVQGRLADAGVTVVYRTPGTFPFPEYEETFKNVYRNAGTEIWVRT